MQSREQAPEVIFEWLSHSNFGMLREDQKEMVRGHFSAEEYDDMHFAICALKAPYAMKTSSSYRIKHQLLEHFDRHQASRPKLKAVSGGAGVFWKAAAVFCVILGSAVTVAVLRNSPGLQTKIVTSTDTVYIERERIVYASDKPVEDSPAGAASVTRKTQHAPVAQEPVSYMHIRPETLNVILLNALDNVENVQKGNSAGEDSLMELFPSITL
jgi:hypothetical protein